MAQPAYPNAQPLAADVLAYVVVEGAPLSMALPGAPLPVPEALKGPSH